MRYLTFLPLCAVGVLLAGCSGDHSAALPTAQSTPKPSTTALGPAESGRLQSGVDTVALRRLLEALPGDVRPAVRATFERHSGHFYQLAPDGLSPELRPLVDAVTAPRSVVADSADVWSAPVTLALLPGEGSGSSTSIRRSASPPSDYIILYDVGLDATRLGQSLRGLALLRLRDGVVARSEYLARVMSRTARSEPQSWMAYLDRKLEELRAAAPRDVPGIGIARVIEIQRVGQ